MIIEDEQGRSFVLTVSIRENEEGRHLHIGCGKCDNQAEGCTKADSADTSCIERYERDDSSVKGMQNEYLRQAGIENGCNISGRMTFALLTEEYLHRYVPEHLKPGTAQTYKNAVDRYLLPAFGILCLTDINARTISDYLSRAHFPNEDRQLTRAKLRMLSYCMRSIMKYAFKQGYIEHDPCVDVIVPERKDRRDTRKKYLEDREIAAFLKLFDDYTQYNTAIKLLLYTGLRSGELLGLKWADIDFHSHVIRVDRSLTNIPGSFILTSPKSEAGRRTIYMNKTIEALLKEHKRYCAQIDRPHNTGHKSKGRAVKRNDKNVDTLLKGRHYDTKQQAEHNSTGNDNAGKVSYRRISGDEIVFTNESGGFLTRQTLNRKFHKATAGTPFATMSLHCLRHSNATILLNNGLDLKLVAEHLGHSKISTTADIYANVTEEGRRKVANVLEKKFNKVRRSE